MIDGDTIEVALGGARRMSATSASTRPRRSSPGAAVAVLRPRGPRAQPRAGRAARRVRLDFDAEHRDVYGRLLAYVYAGATFVNAELVRGGYASTLTIAPNTVRGGSSRASSAARPPPDAGSGMSVSQ